MANSGDPIEAELAAIDQESESPPTKSVTRMIPAGIALVAITAFASVVWYAYNTGIREGSEFAAPVLKPEGPSKVAPKSPGGVNVPNRDKQVYSLVDKSKVSNKVERFAPPPENPLPRPKVKAPKEPALPSPKLKAPSAPPTALNPPPPPPPSITEKRIIPSPPAPLDKKAKAPVVTTKDDPTPPAPVTSPVKAKPAPKVIKMPVPAPAIPVVKKPEPAPKPAPQTASAPPQAPTGAYLIQIASLRSAESARRAWDQSVKRNTQLLDGLRLFVKEKTIKGRGVFYRVQAGPFSSRASAQAKCAELKKSKVPCLVIRP
jgi:hypothetical protein